MYFCDTQVLPSGWLGWVLKLQSDFCENNNNNTVGYGTVQYKYSYSIVYCRTGGTGGEVGLLLCVCGVGIGFVGACLLGCWVDHGGGGAGGGAEGWGGEGVVLVLVNDGTSDRWKWRGGWEWL